MKGLLFVLRIPLVGEYADLEIPIPMYELSMADRTVKFSVFDQESVAALTVLPKLWTSAPVCLVHLDEDAEDPENTTVVFDRGVHLLEYAGEYGWDGIRAQFTLGFTHLNGAVPDVFVGRLKNRLLEGEWE